MRYAPTFTIAIPTADMPDIDFLFRRCLDSLWVQSYQDFEIVVTDNSSDTIIEAICDEYRSGIVYYRNPNKGMAVNTNEAIKRSRGKLIKILYMDDYLAHKRSLNNILDNFEGHWLVTGCTHEVKGEDYFNPHYPYYSGDIHTGNNTIGGPSVLTIKNKEPLLFDEKLNWLLDCDYYRRMFDLYGQPYTLKDINVIMGLHKGQTTNTMSDERKLQEREYIMQKYAATI